ncbi:MAG: fasciclin domain-containing protein, partial [Planctomycetota bacterium]|nr:fasciclin domain-containing protein [Planctomycetota bacterium]
GGCSVYDPRTDPSTLGLARSPGVGQPFGYVSPPTFGEAGIYSVVGAAVATPELSVLVEAVLAAGLADGPLSDPSAEITVLAPVNDAFAALLEALGAGSLGDLDVELVRDVLSYHVIPGRVLSTDLADGMEAGTLLAGAGLTVDLSDGVRFVGAGSDAGVIAADVPAGGAVVHLIDAVLLPTDPEAEALAAARAEALASLPSYLGKPADIYEAAPPAPLPLNADDDVLVGECAYTDWLAGPGFFEYGVPAVDVKIYQGAMDGEPMLYSSMQGYLGPA